MDTGPKPRRKRIRLTLGAMMIVVLGIEGVLSWFAHRAHVQRDAVAAITTPGRNTRGSVYNVTDRGFAHVANLKNLTILDMPGVRIMDLVPVAALAQLDVLSLFLAPTKATSARSVPSSGGPSSLGPLRRLTKLTQLTLGSTRIEDRKLASDLGRVEGDILSPPGRFGGPSNSTAQPSRCSRPRTAAKRVTSRL
jgi:hypothetical protein